MSYPYNYDILISKDDFLKSLSSISDRVHKQLKDIRSNNRRDKRLQPHKAVKLMTSEIANYIYDYLPSYLDGVSPCEEDNHILSRPLGQDILGCELCPKSFIINEVREFCNT